jgi:hypothetical protein
VRASRIVFVAPPDVVPIGARRQTTGQQAGDLIERHSHLRPAGGAKSISKRGVFAHNANLLEIRQPGTPAEPGIVCGTVDLNHE